MEAATEMKSDVRDERARAIAAQTGGVEEMDDGTYAVRSQSSGKRYRVDSVKGTCSCKDFELRGPEVRCKHLRAVRFTLEVEKKNADGTTTTERVRLTYTQAWPAYNAAQKAEVRLFDQILRDLMETIEEPEREPGPGRPPLPLREQFFVAIQKVYSQLSMRRAHSLFGFAVERDYIEHAPNFNTPSRLFLRPEVTPILSRLVQLSALPVASIETDFAVDSSGFRTTTFTPYCGVKHGQKKQHGWLKAHLCTGVKTNIGASAVIPDENGADSPQFPGLVKKTAEGFTISEVSADLAYSGRANLEAVAALGGVPVIPFRRNAKGNARGSTLWRKMFHYFQTYREEFMASYHKRSNVEATNAAIKRKFGDTLKSKDRTAQGNELLAKLVAYNITVVIHEMYENGVEPSFLPSGTVCKSIPVSATE